VEGVANIFISLWYFLQTVDDSLADLENYRLLHKVAMRPSSYGCARKIGRVPPDAHRPVGDVNPHLAEKLQGETRTDQAAVASGGRIGNVRQHAFS
jgi:hypothetical protein